MQVYGSGPSLHATFVAGVLSGRRQGATSYSDKFVSHLCAEIQAMKLTRKQKPPLQQWGDVNEHIRVQQGLSVGAVILLWPMAKRIDLVKALGNNQNGERALWQVFSRVQGSRLSAARLATAHAACDVLGWEDFDEDGRYEDLDGLAMNQGRIEDKLFQSRDEWKKPELSRYDVTRRYFEGTFNRLFAFGYSREVRKVKKVSCLRFAL